MIYTLQKVTTFTGYEVEIEASSLEEAINECHEMDDSIFDGSDCETEVIEVKSDATSPALIGDDFSSVWTKGNKS